MINIGIRIAENSLGIQFFRGGKRAWISFSCQKEHFLKQDTTVSLPA